MADRKAKPGSIINKLHTIISQARKATARPNSQPAISSIMLGRRSFVRKIGRTRGLRMYLVAVGLGSEIRRFLKLAADEGDGVTRDQLELWPEQLRTAVKDIGEARVFVPSRGEFVVLAPMTITSDEVKEAGDYLVDKGNECIRRGERLINLANMMDAA